jgi:hypothetical protein
MTQQNAAVEFLPTSLACLIRDGADFWLADVA